MPGVFGRIGGAIDHLAAPIGKTINRVTKGTAGMNRAIVSARGSMPVGMRGSIADTARMINIKTGRKAIGARSSFRWNWLR